MHIWSTKRYKTQIGDQVLSDNQSFHFLIPLNLRGKILATFFRKGKFKNLNTEKHPVNMPVRLNLLFPLASMLTKQDQTTQTSTAAHLVALT